VSGEQIVREEQIDREALLRGLPLFDGLSDDRLAALASVAWVSTVPAGAAIIEEGDEVLDDEEGLFLLVAGTVEVRKGATDTSDGRLLRTLGPGEFFGEMALIDAHPRSASVFATTEVQYLAISRWDFHRRLRSDPELVEVPAGPFRMGTLDADGPAIIAEYAHAHVIDRFLAKEMPQHEVEVGAFKIARLPVTNREYAAFVTATGARPPRSWPEGTLPEGRGNHPVVRIDHDEAVAYAAWLAGETGRPFRLPTEAEWEKAARGTDGRVYPWGNYFDPARCNTLEGNTFSGLYQRARPVYGVVMRVGSFVVDRGLIGERFDKLVDTTPVGIYPHGASPYGVLDMAGNAEEWTADRFALYPGYPFGDRYDWSAEDWVCRGGAWNRPGDVARVARRHGNFVGTGSIGLRLALTPGDTP
jgi:formylglycine-generating enzyme required for sulfatase activity